MLIFAGVYRALAAQDAYMCMDGLPRENRLPTARVHGTALVHLFKILVSLFQSDTKKEWVTLGKVVANWWFIDKYMLTITWR